MPMRSILALGAVLCLCACGSADDKSGADEGDSPAAEKAASPEQPGKASHYLPDYAPLYPGAKVTSGVGGDVAEGPGGVVTFETSDSPTAVVRFYKAAAEKAGLKSRVEMHMNDVQIYGAEDESGHRSLQVQAKSSESGKTSASIVAARK